jgi:putative alpha-1,2-mannosidase
MMLLIFYIKCASVARAVGDDEVAKDLDKRAKNYAKLWNADTQFMQARNANGSFANDTMGFTEGDHWVYTFDVSHDVDGLAGLFKGGRDGMKAKLDEHFDGGHNMHINEPSHHVPYLYSLIGHPNSAADRIRRIARDSYNATSAGLSGNEDLGQMSAWYVWKDFIRPFFRTSY